MVDSLRYLRDEYTEVYARTRYRIVEISPALARIQKRRAEKEGFGDKVEIINEDVFKWGHEGKVMNEPCYVVALEVFVSGSFITYCVVLRED
jgi:SAM-dependent MidA family methyltransferase